MGVEPTRPAVQDTTVLKTAAATGPLPSPEFRTPFYTRPPQPRREIARPPASLLPVPQHLLLPLGDFLPSRLFHLLGVGVAAHLLIGLLALQP